MSFQGGENVGPYRIVEQLGQGGMASVFKAYHAALDRYVAIKVLHPAFMQEPNFLARFQREARVVARLEHANIVPIYDYSEHQGQPYLVMKYIEGKTLKARLGEADLSPAQGLGIIEAVGAGLAYAHRRGILHRDIKPSNVLLDAEGGIYLADFGLARIAQAGESTLSGDMLLGTPQYISPEQARGEQDLDEGTDIYSLGVVMYELVVGKVPFNADTPFSIIHDHIYTPLPMPRAVNPNVPEPVERVLLKALAKERQDRFESVDQMVGAFRSALVENGLVDRIGPAPAPGAVAAAAATASEGDSSAHETAPSSRSRRWWWAAAGLALACVCLGVFALGVGRQRARTAVAGEASSQAPTAALEATATLAPPETAAPATRPAEPPEVAAARATLAADPENPEAHVALARAYYEAGFPARANAAVMQAADLYFQRSEYAQAAQILTKAIELAGGPERADPAVVDRATEAMFRAAEQPAQIIPLLDTLWGEYPTWGVLLPVSARAAFFMGRGEDAKEQLSQRLDVAPRDFLAKAVQAEILLAEGEMEKGLELGRQVENDPVAPGWLKRHVHEMLAKSKSG